MAARTTKGLGGGPELRPQGREPHRGGWRPGDGECSPGEVAMASAVQGCRENQREGGVLAMASWAPADGVLAVQDCRIGDGECSGRPREGCSVVSRR